MRSTNSSKRTAGCRRGTWSWWRPLGALLLVAGSLPSHGCCPPERPIAVPDETLRLPPPQRGVPRRDLAPLIAEAATAPTLEERDAAAAQLLIEVAAGHAHEERLEERLRQRR